MDLDRNSLRKMAIGFAAVTEVVVVSLSGFAAGYFLDKAIQRTAPWLTVLFTLAGMAFGFYRLYLVYVREENIGKNDDDSKT